MVILDRKKNSIINVVGSWHISFVDNQLWLFTELNAEDFKKANHYVFDMDYTVEETMTKFTREPHFNINKDVEVYLY